MNPKGGAGSNPPAGGSGADPSIANPPAGGLPTTPPAANSPAEGLLGQTPAIPGQGQPAGAPGSNSPAEGSGAADADATREAEWKRENQALRKRLEALEQEKKSAADALLSKEELRDRELAAAQRKVSDHEIERQEWMLKDAVRDEAQSRRLHDVRTAVLLLQRDYGDMLDYDDAGKPTNVPKMLDRLLTKNPWLAAPEPTATPPPPPNSGRVGTPARAANGQFQAPTEPIKPPKTVPLAEMPTLSDVQWSQPRGDLGKQGNE